MKMLKKYNYLTVFLCMLATLSMVIDAKNPVTKKSIRRAQQVQKLRFIYPQNVVRPVRHRFKTIRRNSQIMRAAQTRQCVGEVKKNDTVAVQKSEPAILVKQDVDKQNNQALPALQEVNKVKNIEQTKIPIQKIETQLSENRAPVQKNVSDHLPKKDETSLDKTKLLIGDDSLPEQRDLSENSKDTELDNQNKIDADAKAKQRVEFLKKLAQLPSDQLEQAFAQMNFDEEQKKQIRAQLIQLPAVLKELEVDLQSPHSPAGQAMEGKGWLEWFRKDVLNYSWAKISVSWMSTIWNYTGGALLKKCGLTFSEETKKEIYDTTFEGVDTFLKVIGLDTPGGALDSLFMATVYNYFPKENTWTSSFAKTALAIGYFGALRGMTQKTMIWKSIEAFLCTSYCKYFAQDDANYLRVSYLQRPINFFYHYIPQALKNGWIEWYMQHAIGSYKYLTSLIGIGAQLAHIAMSAASSQPKIAE